jgi:pyrroline-5-carboxylate reductase
VNLRRTTIYNPLVDLPAIAFVGGGNMGRALIGGLIAHGVPTHSIRVGEAIEACRTELSRQFGIPASPDNSVAVQGADVIVLAVKPQDARAALEAIAADLQRRRPLVVSVAAGIRIEDLQSWCGPGVPIVRAMPNRPALMRAGVTGLYAPSQVSLEHRALAERLLRAVGEIVWVGAEGDLDIVTALSGSGPAYCFLLAEMMMQAAASLGLEPQAARTLAVETLYGAGQLAHASDGDLARLRSEVTSKGGTTEAALRVFEADGLGALVARALTAAAHRSRELAAQFGKP